MRAAHQAGRVMALVLVVLLLASTAWICLIGAAIVLLSRWMGAGLALLAVSGALVFLLAIILVVASAVRRTTPPLPSVAQRVLPAVLAQGAKGVITHPLAIRVGLLLIGILLALAAILMPGGEPKGGDPPS